MATYAIGDVQGCMKSLRLLIETIQFDPVRDRLWFVGDLVNRGPDSLAVLRYVKGLGRSAITVLGNHDLHLLAVWQGITELQTKDSFQEILSAPDCKELLNWLRHQPLIHQENGTLLVHAGLLPQWTIPQSLRLAREVEALLRSNDFTRNLPFIYFRNKKATWDVRLSHHERLGLTTNVMTRIRVCSEDGVPDFSFKGPLDEIPKHLKPWFQFPQRTQHQETILFGHWSALGVFSQNRVYCLDGGCVWGRELAALRLEDRKLFRASCGD